MDNNEGGNTLWIKNSITFFKDQGKKATIIYVTIVKTISQSDLIKIALLKKEQKPTKFSSYRFRDLENLISIFSIKALWI